MSKSLLTSSTGCGGMDGRSCPEPAGSGSTLECHLKQCKGQPPPTRIRSLSHHGNSGRGFIQGVPILLHSAGRRCSKQQTCPSPLCLCCGQSELIPHRWPRELVEVECGWPAKPKSALSCPPATQESKGQPRMHRGSQMPSFLLLNFTGKRV